MRFISAIVAIVLAGALGACNEMRGGDSETSVHSIGQYAYAPQRPDSPRVLVTPFRADVDAALRSPDAVGDFTAAQMGELLAKSRRFAIVDSSVLASQADAYRPGQWLKIAPISGVDFILVGQITNLSVAKTAQPPGMVDRVSNFVRQSDGSDQTIVTATCAIGFNLVDPSTGDIVLSNNSEFDRTLPASTLGVEGASNLTTDQPTTLPVSSVDQDRIIRLAVDDAVRKSLPKIDRFLQSRNQPGPTPAPASPGASPTTAPTPESAKGKQICPVCGEENDLTATVCKRCGAKLK